MLSFTPISEDFDRKAFLADLADELSADAEELLDSALDMMDDESEIAVAVHCRHFLLRLFDGDGYWFLYPVPLSDGADTCDVLTDLAAYAMEQMVELRFFDVPEEELDVLREIFPHVDGAFMGDGVFNVEIRNELSLLEDFPEITDGDLSLALITESFADEYFKLMSDPDVNLYYGYDYRSDLPEGGAEDLIRVALAEADASTALTYAVKMDGAFIGDAVLFYPDFRGGAEIAIRLFPSFQGKGIGSRTLKLLVRLASLMGFSKLYARVDGRNLRSLALMDKLFERVGTQECGVVRFSKDLEG